MRMLDLFCGRGGWTNAFLSRGWEVLGVDIARQPDYAGEFLQCGVLSLGLGFVKPFDFICASPPCQEFSKFGMRHFYPDPPYPETGIALFNHARWLCWNSGKPWVLENVKSAQRFVGRSDHACGPFHLWGSGVPLLMPQGITKGFGDMSTKHYHDNLDKISPHIRAKNVATIPPELAHCVAEYAEKVVSQ